MMSIINIIGCTVLGALATLLLLGCAGVWLLIVRDIWRTLRDE